MIRALLQRSLTRNLLALAGAASLLCLASPIARAAGTTKVVTYRGHSVTVPSSWPVYHVSATSTVCVRFNRNAVYLGRPGVNQNCPPHAVGRRDAILIEPMAGAAAPTMLGSARIVDRKHGVVVSATWGRNRSAIRRALGVRSLSRLAAASYVSPKPAPAATQRTSGSENPSISPLATMSPHLSGPASPGSIFSGKGFDACSAPSENTMSAWAASSPYGAIGIYIGGYYSEQACLQPNLTASWVSTESDLGWHLIPIYVGVQAPHSYCGGCGKIKSGQAVKDGEVAADDAVTQAQALGIGIGNPIYYDMEAYTVDRVDTVRVLNFLQAWTGTLRAHGYLSGIYSSTDSGITDLASKYGTSYLEPDDIWFAHWNKKATVSDAALPSDDWVDHHRLHQYRGAVNKTFGGDTIQIDLNYLDGNTAAAGSGHPAATTKPASTVGPTITGKPLVGHVLTEHHANWTGWPYLFSYQWQRCDRSGGNCQNIPGATGTRYRLHTADAHMRFKIVETAGNILGTGTPATANATVRIHKNPSGFWMFSAQGNVWTSRFEAFYGSPSSHHANVGNIVGMAATTDGHGYWLTGSDGATYSYGDAPAYTQTLRRRPIIGIVASPTGGYWQYTAQGNIYGTGGAHFYGSLNSKHVKVHSVVGMAPTPDGGGYWLVTRWGAVYAFGDAPHYHRMKHAHPIIGIVASPNDGYWTYTAHGNIYSTQGTRFHGSMNSKHIKIDTITSMTTTPDGQGYWLASSTGRVYHFGDAKPFRHPHPSVPVVGLVGQ